MPAMAPPLPLGPQRLDLEHQGVERHHRGGSAAHCRASESMTRAIDAGLDCMEHGEFIAPDGTRRFDHDLARRLVVLAVYQDGELVSG